MGIMMRFDGFDWDAGNRDKCGKHGVSVGEIEDLFFGSPMIEPDPAHSAQEVRIRAIGRVGLRWIFLVFTFREDGGSQTHSPYQRALHASQGGRLL